MHWLAAEPGRIATVAKGARQPKSAYAGKLDLAFECDLSFQRARRGDLHSLREVTLVDPRPRLRTDYAYLTQLAYVVGLVEQLTETDTPVPEVYELFSSFLAHLPQQPAQPRNIYAFELKLLASQGLEPDLNEGSLTPGTRELLTRLLELDWLAIAALRPAGTDVRSVRLYLENFLNLHCGKVPRGRGAALGAPA